MNTKQAPQSLSTGARIATAFAVTGIVVAACFAAGHESEKAVQASITAMAPATATIYVTLPSVEIVARRKADLPESDFAANGVTHATNEL